MSGWLQFVNKVSEGYQKTVGITKLQVVLSISAEIAWLNQVVTGIKIPLHG
jgi:hypothetical protein